VLVVCDAEAVREIHTELHWTSNIPIVVFAFRGECCPSDVYPSTSSDGTLLMFHRLVPEADVFRSIRNQGRLVCEWLRSFLGRVMLIHNAREVRTISYFVGFISHRR
jgi:hypothetical protein